MFFKGFFLDVSRETIVAAMKKDGFVPKLVTDKPDLLYEPHQHPETKYLVCLEGSTKITVNGNVYDFEPGDKLIIPENTKHEAIVSKKGCTYFWSEKVIKD